LLVLVVFVLFEKEIRMNRKLCGVLLVLLAVGAFAPQAWGSTLSIASQANFSAYPFTGTPYDISSVGNLDWVVAGYSEKNATQVIATQLAGGSDPFGNTAVLASTPYFEWSPHNGTPEFTWTNGIGGSSNPSPSGNAGFIRGTVDGSVHCGTYLDLPAGSGTITVWWVHAVGGGSPGFSLTFDDTTSVSTTAAGGCLMTEVNYSTAVPQNLTFEMNTYGGFYAMAVSHVPVPEPGTLALLGVSLIGFAAYAWRKRK
jgi:hypothetical protein